MGNEGEKRRAARALIRRSRIKLGLSRQRAALLTGLSVSTHTSIETGWNDRDSTMDTLSLVAEAFGIDIMELISLYRDRWPQDFD